MRRRGGLVAAAVVVGVVVAGFVTIGLLAVRASHPTWYQGYSGPVLLSATGRTLTVVDFGEGCGTQAVVVMTESPARVALSLRLVRLGGGPANCAGPVPPTQQIRLGAPLGSRALVDGATGKAVRWLCARLLLRPRLPAGIRLTSLRPTVPVSSLPGCTQLYGHGDHVYLEVLQGAGSLEEHIGRPGGWTRVPVRGLSGLANTGVLTWQEHGITYYLVASSLTTRQLIAIADSAPPIPSDTSGLIG